MLKEVFAKWSGHCEHARLHVKLCSGRHSGNLHVVTPRLPSAGRGVLAELLSSVDNVVSFASVNRQRFLGMSPCIPEASGS